MDCTPHRLNGCRRRNGSQQRSVRTPRRLLLLVLGIGLSAPAAADDFSLEQQEMRAQLTASRYTTLSAELGAKIASISVKEGDSFKRGQPLIQLDCNLQTAQFDKAKAQLAVAETTYAGNQKLAELNAVGQVELQNSAAEVQKARAEVALMQVTLDKCIIPAPFNGRVAEQKAREQQYVQPGQALLEVLDDSSLELEFIVPTRWVAWLKPGHPFHVRIDDTARTYSVKLLRVGAKADPVSQSVKAVAVVNGRFPELIAGMSGRILLSPPADRND